MSLFTRTAADVDALEASVKALTASDEPIDVRKQSLTSAQQSLAAVEPTVKKYVTKADLGEKDPNKRLYGAAMVTKIRALDQRLATISADLASIAEAIDTKYAEFQRIREKEEADRNAAEEEKRRLEGYRKAEEERTRKEEEARLEAERLEREATLKRQQEAGERARREGEVAEKKRAEEEALAKQQKEAEEAAAMAKLEEQKAVEAAKQEAEAVDKANAKQAGISVTIKTTRGKTLSLTDIPADSKVGHVKKVIEDQHGIGVAAQRLIFQGRLLSDAKTIDTYKIVDGSAVHLVENSRAAAGSGSRNIPSAFKPIVPPGTVCHLENGKEQFESISKNCGKRRLMVVDWSAAWCGPCRMIAPVFERLATRFSDVTFIKIDTEASANSFLAAEKGISAYPTFHFYIDGRLVHSFSGASASGIEAGIRKCRPMVVIADGASSSAARTTAGPSAPGALTQRVLNALTTLKNNCPQQEFIVAVRTLLTFVRNVVDHPGQEKYRKVRTGNKTFQTRLASNVGGMECMRAFGFEETIENGESFLVLSAEAAANSELGTIKTQLEQALAAASGGTQGRPQSSTASAAEDAGQQSRNSASTSPFGSFPGGMLGGMDNDSQRAAMMEMMTDPGFAQVAAELAADPTAVETLMQIQRAIESGDPTALQQLQSNPNLARLQAAIASNPAFMNAMMRRMAGNGFPGIPGMPGMPEQPSMNTQGAGGNIGTFAQNQNTNANPNANPNPNPTQPYPGAPTTAEEEERLLQEAIRLSMQEDNSNQQREGRGNEEDSNDKGL